MLQRLCHRCHSVLHAEDEGTLVFCWNCGAAQVTLSEELQELAATQRAEFASAAQSPQGGAGNAGSLLQVPDLLVLWKPMISIIATVAAAVSVTSIVLPPVELLAWMAPAGVLAIYASRHRQTYITASVGARVGLVCGILVGFGMTVATAARLLVLRFGLHQGSEFVDQLAQVKLKVATQSGQAIADSIVDPFIHIPEFQAGLSLAILAVFVAVLILLSTAGGAFAGFVRSRTRTAAR